MIQRITTLASGLMLGLAAEDVSSRLADLEFRRLVANDCTPVVDPGTTALSAACDCNRGTSCAAAGFCYTTKGYGAWGPLPQNPHCITTDVCANFLGAKTTVACGCPNIKRPYLAPAATPAGGSCLFGTPIPLPWCNVQDGTTQWADGCALCGMDLAKLYPGVTVAANGYCWRPANGVISYATTATQCTTVDGSAAVGTACSCGHTAATATQFCYKDVNDTPDSYHVTAAVVAACAETNGGEAATVACKCGTKFAAIGEFCYDADGGTNHYVLPATMCTAWKGDTAATAVCYCRNGPGNAPNKVEIGQYCFEKTSAKGYVTAWPICVELNGYTAAANDCFCPGAAANDPDGFAQGGFTRKGEYCYDSSTAPYPMVPPCSQLDGETAATGPAYCACGHSSAGNTYLTPLGRYCYASGANNIKMLLFPRCPHNKRQGQGPVSSFCYCNVGTSATMTVVRIGDYCMEHIGIIAKYPLCPLTESTGLVPASSTCTCYALDGTTKANIVTHAGDYCYIWMKEQHSVAQEAAVIRWPICNKLALEHTGAVAVAQTCTCGPKFTGENGKKMAKAGNYCIEMDSLGKAWSRDKKVCSNTDGSVAATEGCWCPAMLLYISAGQYCDTRLADASTNRLPNCEHKDGKTPNPKPCSCGGNLCYENEKYSWNLCHILPLQGQTNTPAYACTEKERCEWAAVPQEEDCLCIWAKAPGIISSFPAKKGQYCFPKGSEAFVMDNPVTGLVIIIVCCVLYFILCCVAFCYFACKKKPAQ